MWAQGPTTRAGAGAGTVPLDPIGPPFPSTDGPAGSSSGRGGPELHARPAGLDAIAIGVRPPDAGEPQALLVLLDQRNELVVGEEQARRLADVIEAVRPSFTALATVSMLLISTSAVRVIRSSATGYQSTRSSNVCATSMPNYLRFYAICIASRFCQSRRFLMQSAGGRIQWTRRDPMQRAAPATIPERSVPAVQRSFVERAFHRIFVITLGVIAATLREGPVRSITGNRSDR